MEVSKKLVRDMEDDLGMVTRKHLHRMIKELSPKIIDDGKIKEGLDAISMQVVFTAAKFIGVFAAEMSRRSGTADARGHAQYVAKNIMPSVVMTVMQAFDNEVVSELQRMLEENGKEKSKKSN